MFLSDRFLKILFLLSLALLPIEAWCASFAAPVAPVEIHIPQNAKVNGAAVVLGDVATIYAKSLRDFEALSKLVLMQFPKGNAEMSVPASYLKARVMELLGKSAHEVKINAPETLHFTHVELNAASPENLSDKILEAAMEQKKIPEGVELIVEPGQGFGSVHVLDWKNFRFEAAFEKPAWKGDMSFRLVPVNTGRDEKIQWFSARLRWFKNVWVAKRDLRFLEDIRATDFERRRVEITASYDQPLDAKDMEELSVALQSARAKRSIRQNSVLTAAHVERKPDGLAGQPLQIVFVAESGLKVSADGALMESAVVGDSVKARLKKSKKIVTGKLVSHNLLEVSL